MALSLLRAPEGSIPYMIFGKLPNRADFIRINATHPVATEFDEFVQNTLEQFRAQENWEECYDLTAVIDFCYPTRDQKWVFTGALISSCDQSLRRYPLIAGAAFPAQTTGAERRLIPIACEVFYEGLREQLLTAIDHSVEALACRQFLESQVKAWSTGVNDLPLANEIVNYFMDVNDPYIIESLLKSDSSPGTLGQALLNIAFYRDFLRRFHNPSTVQIIELPLRGGRGEAALQASVWLSLLSALSGPNKPWDGGFLLRQGQGTARLYATFSRMPEVTLLMAMGGESREDRRLDLCAEQRTWQAHKLYAETAYALDRILSDPGTTLTNLHSFLKEVSQKIEISGSIT